MKSPLIDKAPPKKDPPLSLLQIFKQKATPNEQKIIILACFIVAMSGSLLLGIPILFKDPKLICLSENIVCFEDTACSQDYNIDLKTGPKSLSSEFGLVCEQKQQKTFAITMSFLGIFLGTITSTFILFHAKWRQFLLSLASLIIGASMLGMLCFSDNFFMISILIFTTNYGFVYINVYSYLFLAENFKGELAGFITIMYSVVWGIAGTGFAIIGLCTNANWRIYCAINGTLSAIGGIGFLIVKSEKNYDDENDGNKEERPSLCSYFRDMWPNIQIRKNFIVYALFWGMNAMVYSMILVEVESLGGNLYINCIVCSLLELASTLATGAITKKYNCFVLLRYILTLVSIFFSIFIFCPPNLITGSNIQVCFFVFCLFVIKVICNSLHIVTYLYLPKAFTDKYVGFWMLCSRFWARFILLLVPTISYLMRSIGLHPFCFYGFCWIICRIIFRFTKEVQSEGVDDLLNEAEVNDFERMSVLTGSFGYGAITHDDNLVNIKVDGVPLSVVRKFKQEGGSFKNSSEFLKLRDSVLKRSKVTVKGEKMSLFELKEKFIKI